MRRPHPGHRAAANLGVLAVVACVAFSAFGALGVGAAAAGHRPAAPSVKAQPTGRLLTVAGSLGSGPARFVAQQPAGLAVTPAGAVIVADDGSNAVRQLSATGGESVLAGSGVPSYNGDARPASTASLGAPAAVAEVAGGIAVADTSNQRVRLIATATCHSLCPFGLGSTTAGDIYTITGSGIAGYSGDRGPATSARLDAPGALAVDASGDLLIADTYSNAVRLVAATGCASSCPFGLGSTTAGDIYTIAGDGRYGSSGNGGSATSAQVATPTGLAVDASGGVIVAASGSNQVRFVAAKSCSAGCPFGLPSTSDGHIYALAGSGSAGHSGDGHAAAGAELDAPSAVTIGPQGDLLVADALNNVVRLVAAVNCASACPFGLASTKTGDIYAVAGDGTAGSSGDGSAALHATLTAPTGLALDSAGDLLIADPASDRLREVAAATCRHSCRYGLASTTAGDVYTVAGTGSPSASGDRSAASKAELDSPTDVATDGRGDLFVADTGDNRVRMTAGATCKKRCPFALATTRGDIYTVAGSSAAGSAGNGGAATRAGLDGPSALTVGPSGDLIVADTANNQVRLVAAVTCSRSCPYGLASTKAGDIYAVAGTRSSGYSGNRGPARRAELSSPSGLVIGPSGDLLVADTGNDTVRLVAEVTCRTRCPFGLSSTAVGDIYAVAGSGTAGSSGQGGPAVKAALSDPTGLAVGPSGDLIVADSLNNRVVLLANAACRTACPYGLSSAKLGDLYTVAGDGGYGGSGDGHPAKSATLAFPTGVATDGAGNLFVADLGNNSVRVVWNEHCLHSCAYGAASSTAGEIWTISGDGNLETSPDGQPAAGRPLAAPIGVTSAPGGGVDVVEARHGEIRRILPVPTDGYSFVTAPGGVFNFGAPFYGSLPKGLRAHIVAIAADPLTGGDWLAGSNGAVYAIGAAPFMGSMRGHHLRAPIVGIASTPAGNGYWLVGSDGEVYPFGAARSHGSLLGKKLAHPVVGMAASPAGEGYWLVTSGGAVYPFGRARADGSARNLTNIVGIVATPNRGGYWLFGSDGRVLTFGGAHNWGSLLHIKHSAAVVGMTLDPGTGGYRLVTARGGVYPFRAPGYGTSGTVAGVAGIATGE